MARVDILITNPNHHLAITMPVAEALREQGHSCRFLSLCEWRGFVSPQDEFARRRIPLHRLLPLRIRRSPTDGLSRNRSKAPGKEGLARRMVSQLVLFRLAALLRDRPDVVLLANDVAFPTDRIVKELHRRAIPYVLAQEGIRFPLPNTKSEVAYGTGGATRIAAWGRLSADYFIQQGVPEQDVVPTGTPRFDGMDPGEYREQGIRLREQLELRGKTLLLVSNPVDVLGFCTTDAKLGLIDRFATLVEPLFVEDDGFRLIVSMHPHEDAEAVRQRLSKHPFEKRIHIPDRSVPLYHHLAAADAAVVLASTVGLEALIFGLPLGVVEIPGHGFVHDYVASNAALGLKLDPDLANVVGGMLAGNRGNGGRQYVADSIETFEDASTRIASLVSEVATNARGEMYLGVGAT